jgi:hypothetical protein
LLRASADVELHSDEEGDAPDSAMASPIAAAEQHKAGLRVEQSSASDSDLSGACQTQHPVTLFCILADQSLLSSALDGLAMHVHAPLAFVSLVWAAVQLCVPAAGSRIRRESYSVSEATTLATGPQGLLHTDPRFIEQEVLRLPGGTLLSCLLAWMLPSAVLTLH